MVHFCSALIYSKTSGKRYVYWQYPFSHLPFSPQSKQTRLWPLPLRWNQCKQKPFSCQIRSLIFGSVSQQQNSIWFTTSSWTAAQSFFKKWNNFKALCLKQVVLPSTSLQPWFSSGAERWQSLQEHCLSQWIQSHLTPVPPQFFWSLLAQKLSFYLFYLVLWHLHLHDFWQIATPPGHCPKSKALSVQTNYHLPWNETSTGILATGILYPKEAWVFMEGVAFKLSHKNWSRSFKAKRIIWAIVTTNFTFYCFIPKLQKLAWTSLFMTIHFRESMSFRSQHFIGLQGKILRYPYSADVPIPSFIYSLH